MSDYENIKHDPFWFKEPKIIFQSDRLIEFIPKKDMSYNEKLNAILRFGIYLSIILFFINQNFLVFYIPIFLAVFTYFLHENHIKNENKKRKLIRENFQNQNKYRSLGCVKPTIRNPFMNAMLTDIKYNPKRLPACNSYNSSKIRNDIESAFDNNLYKNLGDIYGRENSQRQFYTMPSTTIPNDQEMFAKWLYQTPGTCKDGNSSQCVANMYDPILANTQWNWRYI